ISGLLAGTYTVTITDANGCETTDGATIGEPDAALSSSAIATDVACFGEATGSIDLTVNGGTPGYSYLWSNGAITEDISGLIAGTYTVTITDANGCETTDEATVGQPDAALSASAVGTDALCNGDANGSIDLTVSGGTTAYSFIWSNGATTEDISGLTAGTYSVTITDANGCTTTASATVNEPAALMCTVALDNGVSVNGGNDGAATVNPTGGTAGYSYVWDNGETTQQAIALTAGTHSVTVT
ncbi:SprB repeat-containing protein, partial [Muriicola sp. Z0-33]|uniref:SprB repeat-containing protein n=1 Tax=Muriicola sp. Z0-33 TaxID=2816957 RepID=UPI0022370D0A